MWILEAFLSAFFAGITAVLAKVGIKNVDSHLATALRTIVVTLFAWLMVLITGSFSAIADVTGTTLLFLVLSGLTTGASWLCYFKAISLGDIVKIAPIDKSSTILTMLLAFLFLGEPITWLKALCIVLIGAGTYMMIRTKPAEKTSANTDTPKGSFFHRWAWFLYAALSAVFAALTTILGKIGVQDIPSNLGTAIRCIVVLILAWAIVLMQGTHRGIRKIDGRSLLFLVLSGIATGLSWLCYYSALKNGSASIVAPIDKLSILVTVLFSSVFLKEKLSPLSAAGLVVMTAGTLLLLV